MGFSTLIQKFWSLQLLHHFRTYNNALVSYYATSTDQKMAYRQRIANLNAWSCPALKMYGILMPSVVIESSVLNKK
jgi:hypothetical protein